MILLLGFGLVLPQGVPVFAGEEEPTPKVVLAKNLSPLKANAGSTIHVAIPVRALNAFVNLPSMSVDTDNMPYTVESDMILTREGYAKPVQEISMYETTNIEFDLKIDDTAKIGTYKLNINFAAVDRNGDGYEIKLSSPVTLKVIGTKSKPSLIVTSLSVPKAIRSGGKFNVKFQVSNEGELLAKGANVSIDGFTADGIVPDYTTLTSKLGDLEQNAKSVVNFPMKVAKQATAGLKTLTIKLACTDIDGTAYTAEVPIYINVSTSEMGGGDPNIMISGVTQTPKKPVAGQVMSVSFYLQNKSSLDITEIQITPTNLTSANFSPLKSEPYKYIASIKAGQKKKVTMNLRVSKDVIEGLNELVLSYTYKDKTGKTHGPITAKLFILNVQNPEDQGSTPKLIISNFKAKTKKKELKAGDTFTFLFDVQNTNHKVSARNIKVTMSSTDNVFSVTKGSNSFYIPIIKAGATKKNELPLKVKSDCVTKTYPMEIKFEYEYDGMPKPKDGTVSTGVTVTETLNLQVTENARPVVSNISLAYGETAYVGTPTTLNFDFYNLGKSVLNNVVAKIKSKDFETDSNMLFIGNVAAGSGDAQEIEITPKKQGLSKGTLVISYEDSNGDTVEVPTKFQAEIQEMAPIDPGTDQQEPIPEQKKAILNPWLFALIEVILLIAMIFIGKKLTLSWNQKKLQKQEEELSLK